MKLRVLFPPAAFASLVLTFACGAAPWATGRVIPLASNGSNEAQVLREAYSALRAADHDYQGHRHKAMEAIEAAGKALGEDVRGDGKGHEPQAESDEHLKKAQKLLERLATNKSGRIGKHIEHALSELTTALSIK